MSAHLLRSDGAKILLDKADLARIEDDPDVGGCHYTGKERYTALWSSKQQKSITLHTYLMQPEAGQRVDHINRDILDNRRANLRLASSAENNWNRKAVSNRTGYTGVQPSGDKYIAYIQHKGERIHIGSFDTPEQSARARDAKALELRGKFARLNFPLSE